MITKSCFVFLFTATISSTSFAEEFEFIVSPENCGKMTLEECEEFMIWAKEDMEKTDKRIAEKKAKLASMHEEALQILSERTQEK